MQISRSRPKKLPGQGRKSGLGNEDVIIASDTYYELNGKLFEKPKNLMHAKEMLRQLSGQKVINHNGFCYIDRLNHINFSTTKSVKFSFRQFSEKEIEAFVNTFPVTTWAAACSPA